MDNLYLEGNLERDVFIFFDSVIDYFFHYNEDNYKLRYGGYPYKDTYETELFI
jgi:hypothetical protein